MSCSYGLFLNSNDTMKIWKLLLNAQSTFLLLIMQPTICGSVITWGDEELINLYLSPYFYMCDNREMRTRGKTGS